jgi:hypothetical protein
LGLIKPPGQAQSPLQAKYAKMGIALPPAGQEIKGTFPSLGSGTIKTNEKGQTGFLSDQAGAQWVPLQ